MTYPPDFIADALRPLCWTRVKWEVLEAPHEAQYEPGHTFETQSIGFVPRDGDIGLWRFGCTAIDNEKEKDFEKISVQVRNLPPEIDLVDEAIQVETGETVQVETKIVDDPDNGEGGGGLTFQWDIIQAPLGANTGVMKAFDPANPQHAHGP